MLRIFLCVTLIASAAIAQAQEAATHVLSATLAREIESLKAMSEQQRWGSVLDRSTRLRSNFPESSELALFQIAANKELGRNEETRRSALDFLERYPDSVNKDQALFLLGSALLLSGTRVEAASYLLEASRVTDDPTLRQKIRQTLPPERNPMRIGIDLNGKPPENEEEMKRALEVAERIVAIAVEEFTRLHGHPPELMEELLQGDPPILKALPEDPRYPGRSIPFKREIVPAEASAASRDSELTP